MGCTFGLVVVGDAHAGKFGLLGQNVYMYQYLYLKSSNTS